VVQYSTEILASHTAQSIFVYLEMTGPGITGTTGSNMNIEINNEHSRMATARFNNWGKDKQTFKTAGRVASSPFKIQVRSVRTSVRI
jgi:hypothetical protein